MNKNIMIYWVAALLTVMLSSYQHWLNPVFNVDGVTYLRTASQFLLSGSEAFHHLHTQGHWPFYSILIAGVAKLSMQNVWVAAILLNHLIHVAVVLLFVRALACLGASLRVQWFGVLVVLSWHMLTSLWGDFLRDHGFHVCVLLSFVALCVYADKPSWKNALFWLLATFLAFLFRREGIVYLAFMPLALLCIKKEASSLNQAIQAMLKLYLPLLLLAGAAGLYLMQAHVGEQFNLEKFHRLLLKAPSKFMDHLASDAIIAHINSVYWQIPAGILLILVRFIGATLSTVGPTIGLGVFYMFIYRGEALPQKNRQIWFFCVALALLIPLIFMLESFFVGRRYIVPFGLMLMLSLPFVLEHIYVNKRSVWAAIIGAALVYSIVVSLTHFGPNYALTDREAGLWLKTNLPADAVIMAGDKQVLFYVSQPPYFQRGEYVQLQKKAIGHYQFKREAWQCADYLVLAFRVNDPQKTDQFLLDKGWVSGVVQEFSDAKHRRLIQVFKVNKSTACENNT